jgi:hypothetical protein
VRIAASCPYECPNLRGAVARVVWSLDTADHGFEIIAVVDDSPEETWEVRRRSPAVTRAFTPCAGKTRKSTSINVIVRLPYLMFPAIGTVLAVRLKQVRLVSPLALLIVYHFAVYASILPQARYSVPVIPFLSSVPVSLWRQRRHGS